MNRRSCYRPFWPAAGLVMACACAGEIAPPGDRRPPGAAEVPGSRAPSAPGGTDLPGGPPPPSPPTSPPAATATPIACAGPAGPAPLRMLTPTEYDNTVRDLLGDTTAPAAAWPAPASASGFDNDAFAQSTDQNQADLHRATAERLARTASSTNLARLAPCDLATAACVTTFIDTFGARAYRRPLDAEDRARLQKAFDLGRSGGTPADGVRTVVELALQSPHFLYRVEVGTGAPAGPGRVALTDHELASRLSYFLWNSMPDAALFAAARAGELRTQAQLRAQVERMLADPKARGSIANFHRQWLYFDLFRGAQKDPRLFPGYSAATNASMVQGSQELLAHTVLGSPKGDLTELLTGSHAFANADTAPLLGVPAAAAPRTKAFVRVELDPAKRAGILTDLTVMASLAKPAQTAPVLRGVFVREHLLCQTIPPPPPDVDNAPPVPDPRKTTRQQLSEHRESPSCAGCHTLMDPVGFGFENYDALGQYRTTENGLPVDASGELTGTRGADGRFTGAVELARKLAAADEVSACVTRQWFRYAFGRADTDADACALESLRARAGGQSFRLRELLIAIATSADFGGRPAAAQNGGCN